MAAKKITAPALAEGQEVTVVEYDHLGKIKRTTPGVIHRVGRSIVEVDVRGVLSWTHIVRFDKATGRARDDSRTRVMTDEQLVEDQHRAEALAVLARHNLRPVDRHHGWEHETELDTDTLAKIAAVITEAEKA